MNINKTGNESVKENHDFFDKQTGAFFRKVDWSAFWVAFLIAFGVYFFTLAPTVTLEDSGELAVASDYLGVPHPPGYPIWTLCTWFFQWIFHWVLYFGQPDSNLMIVWKSVLNLLGLYEGPSHPNPAWSVGLASAFFGALASGFFGMLVSRSGTDILRGWKRATDIVGRESESAICWATGVAGGLLFAFTPVLWSQSVIVEVYSMNAFFLCLILLLTYRWMCRPHENTVLYITAFLFGLGLTNHQTLLFAILGLLTALWFCNRELFRDSLAALFLAISGKLFFDVVSGPSVAQMNEAQINARNMSVLVAIILLFAPIALFFIKRRLFSEWKRVLIMIFLVALGISFYAYMPVASEQNPPMNWGYPRTMEGFMHAISRGQYEKISPTDNLKDAITRPGHFFKLLNAVITNPKDYISVVAQFTWPISLFALLPFIFMGKISRRTRHWLIVTLISFISLTVIFLVFQYPDLDVQTLFIGRVQYIQAHAIFALWISYGLMFALIRLDMLAGGRKAVNYVGLAAVCALVLVPIVRNQYDEEYIKMVGAVEQNGHDFGWQFGYWQLRGANGILEELSEDEKAAYPNPSYPPEMTTNAIFFGGTDPGRFVPTYMIYSAKVRSDTYLITQNALADNTYMNVMRDLYGDTIWIPSQKDSNYAFQQYVEDVQAGRIPPGAAVSIQDGRVSVQGVQGVMMINGILAEMIFDANKHKHDFYVEESYVIPWMYPYLEPHGLIMKINKEPLPGISDEIVKNDREFWDWFTQRSLTNQKFHRDVVARKTFSKLRSAIAGIYTYRNMLSEAEYAFRQAIDLYPLSPEANFRLADVLMKQRRFSDARELIQEFLIQDPGNDKVAGFLKQIQNTENAESKRIELEQKLSEGTTDINAALELSRIYQQLMLNQQFEQLTRNLLQNDNVPPQAYLHIAQMYADGKRLNLLVYALERYLKRNPNDAQIWLDLAAAQASNGKAKASVAALNKSIQLGGEQMREAARNDQRFQPIRNTPEFQRVVPQRQQNVKLPFSNF